MKYRFAVAAVVGFVLATVARITLHFSGPIPAVLSGALGAMIGVVITTPDNKSEWRRIERENHIAFAREYVATMRKEIGFIQDFSPMCGIDSEMVMYYEREIERWERLAEWFESDAGKREWNGTE